MNVPRNLGVHSEPPTMIKGKNLQWGQDHSQMRWNLWATPPMSSSPSPDCGFESDQSSASTSSSVSSRSDRSGGSRQSHDVWCNREIGGHMKINLPVLKDDDMKDTISYESWHLLPYTICSLQGYLGELMRSLGRDIILEDVLAILDEHLNNVKALHTLNQELFQLWMGKKETVSDWGFVEASPSSCSIIPGTTSARPHHWAERWSLL